MKKIILATLLAGFAIYSHAQTFNYTFETGKEGWAVDYADYPVLSASDSLSFYELINSHAMLPAYIMPNQYGIKIRGNNHSDDLFMFLKKKISGLLPHTAYNVYYNIEIASNARTNAFGVGGSPGEGVVVKAGVTLTEPRKVNVSGEYLMNINKGNQAAPGPDMDTIGHVGVTDTTTVYTLIHRNNFSHPFSFTTDASGEAWLIAGTESGYEAETEIYYASINAHFSIPAAIDDPLLPGEITIFPNPATDKIHIYGHNIKIDSYNLLDVTGRVLAAGNYSSAIDISQLPRGLYYIQCSTAKGIVFQKILKE